MYNTEIAARFFEWFVKQPEGPRLFKQFCEENGIDIKQFLGTHYKCKLGFKAAGFGWFYHGQIISEEKYNSLGIVNQVGNWEKITINAADNTNCEKRKSSVFCNEFYDERPNQSA